MNHEPDLRFDIDGLFAHMVQNLGHDIADELDWHFDFRSAYVSKLERLAAQLGKEFRTELQKEVEEIHADGRVSLGPPLLRVIRRGALTPQEVKTIASRISRLAKDEGIAYQGVTCYDPVDEEEILGWLDIDEAVWRLRHFTDSGLATSAELPWAFLVVARELERLHKVAATLNQAGYEKIEVYDNQDDDGFFGLCLFKNGKDSESELRKNYEEIAKVAKQHEAHIRGVQFLSEDELCPDDSEDKIP